MLTLYAGRVCVRHPLIRVLVPRCLLLGMTRVLSDNFLGILVSRIKMRYVESYVFCTINI